MKAIPEFPNFANVDLAVKSEIEGFICRLPAYSDFNFVNLFSWNHSDMFGVAWLNGNLVLRFADYIDSHPFFSLIGAEDLIETAMQLLGHLAKSDQPVLLKLIPEIVALVLADSEDFKIFEDQDSHDYLLSVDDLAHISGRKQAHTREQVNRFRRENGLGANFTELDLSQAAIRQEIIDVFSSREDPKQHNDSANELRALERLMAHSKSLNLSAYGVRVHNNLEAFVICEEVSSEVVIAHFWKANISRRGIYQFMLHEVCKQLLSYGYTLLNFEQDLGLPGLRAAKNYLRPIGFLRKYIVRLTPDLAAFETESPKELHHIRIAEIDTELASPIN